MISRFSSLGTKKRDNREGWQQRQLTERVGLLRVEEVDRERRRLGTEMTASQGLGDFSLAISVTPTSSGL